MLGNSSHVAEAMRNHILAFSPKSWVRSEWPSYASSRGQFMGKVTIGSIVLPQWQNYG